MKQMSLASTGFELVTKRMRKREFLDEMNLVIPWSELLALITPHAPAGRTGRPPFATEVMLRIHLLQQFFGHSDPTMEEELHDIPLYQEFAHLDAGMSSPAVRARAQRQAQLGRNEWESTANPTSVSPYECSRLNSRFGGGHADHP